MSEPGVVVEEYLYYTEQCPACGDTKCNTWLKSMNHLIKQLREQDAINALNQETLKNNNKASENKENSI